MTESSSCAGACCSVFYLGEVARLRRDPDSVVDGPFILDMIVPLTTEEAIARYARLGYGELPEPGDNLFTCRHWDETTRLCGVYDERPGMCRGYPYGRPCQHGCSFQA